MADDLPIADGVIKLKAEGEQQVKTAIKGIEREMRGLQTTAQRAGRSISNAFSPGAQRTLDDLRAQFASHRSRLDAVSAHHAAIPGPAFGGRMGMMAAGGAIMGAGSVFGMVRHAGRVADRMMPGSGNDQGFLMGNSAAIKADFMAAAEYSRSLERTIEGIGQGLALSLGKALRAVASAYGHVDDFDQRVATNEAAARGRRTIQGMTPIAGIVSGLEDRQRARRDPMTYNRYSDMNRFRVGDDRVDRLVDRAIGLMVEEDFMTGTLPAIQRGLTDVNMARIGLMQRGRNFFNRVIGSTGAQIAEDRATANRLALRRMDEADADTEEARQRESIENRRWFERMDQADYEVEEGRRREFVDQTQDRLRRAREQVLEAREAANVRMRLTDTPDVYRLIQEAISPRALDEANETLELIADLQERATEATEFQSDVLQDIHSTLDNLNLGFR